MSKPKEFVVDASILISVGYLCVNKEGHVARQDGGTIVARINDMGWGDQSPDIAEAFVHSWNKQLQEWLLSSQIGPLEQRKTRLAHEHAELFCWCLEHLSQFPPPPGKEWVDEVKDRLLRTTKNFVIGIRLEAENVTLREQRDELLAALNGVVAVADRQTVEFDAARRAIENASKAPPA